MENEEDPLLEREEKDDDDDDTTHHFQPGEASTPSEEIPMTTLNREREKEPTTAETYFIEGSPLSRVLASNAKAWETLTEIFPEAKATELEATYSKTGKLQVKKFGFGKRAYPLFTVARTGEQRLNSFLPKEIKSALGPEHDVLIVQKEKEIEELQESIREDEEITNNENEQPSVRERTREKIAEKREQIDALENEREELEEKLSLREKVKNIFKKYGFTTAAVFLAVGTTIGVIVNSLTKGLKSVATGVGNGLKELGKKIAQILPGLIGSIASFIFKTAGSVISFLGKNAWLLILGVAIFMVERLKKNRSFNKIIKSEYFINGKGWNRCSNEYTRFQNFIISLTFYGFLLWLNWTCGFFIFVNWIWGFSFVNWIWGMRSWSVDLWSFPVHKSGANFFRFKIDWIIYSQLHVWCDLSELIIITRNTTSVYYHPGRHQPRFRSFRQIPFMTRLM